MSTSPRFAVARTHPVAVALWLVAAACGSEAPSRADVDGSPEPRPPEGLVDVGPGDADGPPHLDATPNDADDAATPRDGDVDDTDAADPTADASDADASDPADPPVDAGTSPRPAGEPCDTAADCDTSLCLTTGEGGVCAIPCAERADCDAADDCLSVRTPDDGPRRACVAPELCRDEDGDGVGAGPACDPADCDDAESDVYPGAPETCDGRDESCSGTPDDAVDEVGDACTTGLGGRCDEGTVTCEEGATNCQPTAERRDELCDALDNDCDGLVDEGEVCVSEPCCWDERCEGVCGAAVRDNDGVCARPADEGEEVCDGLDNDCDGAIDEGVLRTWWRDNDGDGWGDADATMEACSAPAGWVERAGDCDDGDASVSPDAAEACDGIDRDCSGTADDGGVCDGSACCWQDVCRGVCARAVTDAARVCQPPDAWGDELCDGLDNDCDGAVDEGELAGAGEACTSSLPGLCAEGARVCAGGALTCRSLTAASAELCDGLDNDCDGSVDEGNPEGGVGCNTGESGVCAAGRTLCSEETLTCMRVTEPSPETCDGLDNDCDGAVDNDVDGVGASCSTGLPGVCDAGRVSCRSGALTCRQLVLAGREVCDGADNDCDGIVDEDTPSAVQQLTWSELAPHGALCDGVTEFAGPRCSSAIGRFCATQACGATGFGPLERTFEVLYALCLPEDRVRQRAGSWAELSARQAPCDGTTEIWGPNCSAAIHRACADEGLTTGFGPTEHDPTGASWTCVPDARLIESQYSVLVTHHPGCTGASGEGRFGSSCNAAIHRFCRAQGYESGWGPVENFEDMAQVICVNAAP